MLSSSAAPPLNSARAARGRLPPLTTTSAGAATSPRNASATGASESDLTDLAAKYSKEGYAFSTVASDAPVADALRGDVAAPALVVVKGGKRPRAARAELSGGAALLDSIAGGGASFAKFSGGLPAWPEAEPEEPAAEEEGDEYDL